MHFSRSPLARLAGLAFVVGLALAPIAQAGINTWTFGGPHQPGLAVPTLMATDPRDPYIVYAVFQPSLYKSHDGGRTWTLLASFVHIEALLVHPAAPDTLYVGATHGVNAELAGVLKSEDGGVTWVSKPFGTNLEFGLATALAGSPTDANVVFAGAGGSAVLRSLNGGASWDMTDNMPGVIASLVISPRDTRIVYAGSESYSYYYGGYYPGAFARSGDGGLTWTRTIPAASVSAIALDPDVSTRVYVGLAGDLRMDDIGTGVRRSDDGGVTFSNASNGLPTGTLVSSLILDPADSSTLYAGTNRGVFRSRDSGANWSALGQVLSSEYVQSLAISGDGRRLHASTWAGSYHMDLVSGPVDVAATAGGGAKILRWNTDRLAVQTVDGSNHWTASPFSATTQTWTGVAIGSAGDGSSRVLWNNGDGRSALEVVSASGGSSSFALTGLRGMSDDLVVGADGTSRILVTSPTGAMHFVTIRADGTLRQGPAYGPTAGWSAIAVDADAQGRAWALWRSADGRGAISLHVDGTLVHTVKWGATEGWWAEDLAVGADGRARVLARNVAGALQVWTVGEDGSRSVGATHESPGLVPRRIAAGADGLTRVLWGGDHGEGSVWFLTDSGNHVAVDVPVLP